MPSQTLTGLSVLFLGASLALLRTDDVVMSAFRLPGGASPWAALSLVFSLVVWRDVARRPGPWLARAWLVVLSALNVGNLVAALWLDWSVQDPFDALGPLLHSVTASLWGASAVLLARLRRLPADSLWLTRVTLLILAIVVPAWIGLVYAASVLARDAQREHVEARVTDLETVKTLLAALHQEVQSGATLTVARAVTATEDLATAVQKVCGPEAPSCPDRRSTERVRAMARTQGMEPALDAAWDGLAAEVSRGLAPERLPMLDNLQTSGLGLVPLTDRGPRWKESELIRSAGRMATSWRRSHAALIAAGDADAPPDNPSDHQPLDLGVPMLNGDAALSYDALLDLGVIPVTSGERIPVGQLQRLLCLDRREAADGPACTWVDKLGDAKDPQTYRWLECSAYAHTDGEVRSVALLRVVWSMDQLAPSDVFMVLAPPPSQTGDNYVAPLLKSLQRRMSGLGWLVADDDRLQDPLDGFTLGKPRGRASIQASLRFSGRALESQDAERITYEIDLPIPRKSRLCDE